MLATWVDPESGAIRESPGDGWDEPSRSLLREVWRDYSRAKKLPSRFCHHAQPGMFPGAASVGGSKGTSRLCEISPKSPPVLSLKREEAEYLGYQDSPYNALLDVYEPGSTIAASRPLFEQIKGRLVPLLKKIQQSSVQIDDAILFTPMIRRASLNSDE